MRLLLLTCRAKERAATVLDNAFNKTPADGTGLSLTPVDRALERKPAAFAVGAVKVSERRAARGNRARQNIADCSEEPFGFLFRDLRSFARGADTGLKKAFAGVDIAAAADDLA